MTKNTAAKSGIKSLERLYARPGFLLRRAHQISESVFHAEFAAFGLTPPQAGCLVVAHSCPGLDQKAIGLALGFDRANTGEILKGLEARGLIVRAASGTDGRRRSIAVTVRGRQILERAGEALDRIEDKLLAPLSAQESAVLSALLTRLCDAHNGQTRTPLIPPVAD